MRDQTALYLALARAGYTPDQITMLLDGWVWLGDLSGMEAVPTAAWVDENLDQRVRLAHRCGQTIDTPSSMEGMVADGSVMLGNLVEYAVKARATHACDPHQLSPEHRERIARWAAAAGHQPAQAGHLAGASEEQTRDVLGDVATDQLDVIRRLSRGGRIIGPDGRDV